MDEDNFITDNKDFDPADEAPSEDEQPFPSDGNEGPLPNDDPAQNQNSPIGDLAKKGGKKLLMETSSMWGPVAIGVVIVLVIVLIIASVFMAGDQAAATPAPTGSTPTVICLDPGHLSDDPNGPKGNRNDTGASAPDGTSEIHMNWITAQSLQTALKNLGYDVVLTKKSENEFVTNKERVDRCAAAGAAFDFRIHMDSPGSSFGGGPWIEYPGPSYKNVHDDSMKYAKAIEKSLVDELSLKKTGPQPINGGTREDTKKLEGSVEANAKNIPVALIEMMTMENVNVDWLKDDTNRTNFVKAIADGIKSCIPVTGGGSIVAVAKQELAAGAHEVPDGANCGDGVNKYTDGNCEMWCADFVSWVLKTAGHPFTGGYSGGWRISYVPDVKAWFEKQNEFLPNNGKNTPQPGDVVIHMAGSSHHVNIVISVSGSTITVIGGNQSNAVTQRTEDWHDSYIVGFGRVK